MCSSRSHTPVSLHYVFCMCIAALAPLLGLLSCNPLGALPVSFHCLYSSSSSGSSSSSSSSSGGSASNKTKQQALSSSQKHKQQHPSHDAAAATGPAPWPRPSRLVLPKKRVTASILGRVPPTSKAAAAATAHMLKAANPPIHLKVAAQLATSEASTAITGNATNVDKAICSRGDDSNSGSSNSNSAVQPQDTQPEAVAAKAAVLEGLSLHAYPWEVVATLPAHSPYPLEAMAEMDITLYINYMRDSRLGMPSVFELGTVREQGFQGRMQLLRREQLLKFVLLQLQQATNDTGNNSEDFGAEVLTQHDSSSSSSSNIPDELLQELTQEQFEAAAAAASAAHAASTGATPEEVADCLLDYFVFKRCAQLMLLQRQHRQLMQQQHEAFLDHQQQQRGSVAEVQPEFTAEELAAVGIWDAFFDATLLDYLLYLDLAAAGAPSVFTTMNPNAPEQQQQQPDTTAVSAADGMQQQQHYAACQLLLQTTKILGLLPNGMIQRPGLLIGKQQLLQLAVGSGSSVQDVAEVLQDFYKLKRLGFRAALEQLLEVANEQSALQRF